MKSNCVNDFVQKEGVIGTKASSGVLKVALQRKRSWKTEKGLIGEWVRKDWRSKRIRSKKGETI